MIKKTKPKTIVYCSKPVNHPVTWHKEIQSQVNILARIESDLMLRLELKDTAAVLHPFADIFQQDYDTSPRLSQEFCGFEEMPRKDGIRDAPD